MKRSTGIKTYHYETGLYIVHSIGKSKLNIMVTDDGLTYEATMYCNDIGISGYMFGAMKKTTKFSEFIGMVENSLPDYAIIFEDTLYKVEKGE